MKSVHLTLQGKGGVGKSFIASLIAQYILSTDAPLIAVDTDPVNATFAGYKAFNTERLELMNAGIVDERNFDSLIEKIVSEDAHFVIDNGASSFIPLSNYMIENDAINVINQHEKQVVIHTVITGGPAMRDTLAGLAALVEQMPEETQIVVWLNEFFGSIESEGKSFENMKAYQNNRERIHGIVRIPRRTESTFGQDIQLMQNSKMTFDEIAQSESFGLMAKARIAQVKKGIFDQLATVI